MFTGIIKEIGIVKSIENNAEGRKLRILSKVLIKNAEIDDSISVNGVCQTIIRLDKGYFEVQVVQTTLEKTTLGLLKINEEVNMELALRPIDRMGGHWVQGHVNTIGKIEEVKKRGNSYLYYISLSKDNFKYIVDEGSITIDGISLTVAKKLEESGMIQLAIIPHTIEQTVLKNRVKGSKVNIEVDILAKYIENFIGTQSKNAESGSKISLGWLKSKGF